MQTQTDRQDDGCTHIYTSTHYFSFYTSPLSKLPAVSYHLFVPSKNPTDIWTPETCSFSLCKDTHTHTHTLPHPQCGPTSLLDFNDQRTSFAVTHQWLSFFCCLFNPLLLPPPLHRFPSLASLCEKRGRTSAVRGSLSFIPLQPDHRGGERPAMEREDFVCVCACVFEEYSRLNFWTKCATQDRCLICSGGWRWGG